MMKRQKMLESVIRYQKEQKEGSVDKPISRGNLTILGSIIKTLTTPKFVFLLPWIIVLGYKLYQKWKALTLNTTQ